MIRAAVPVLAATLLFAAPAAGVPASIRILTGDPVKVAGRGFPARAKIHVTLSSGFTKMTRTVRSSRIGRFTVTFDVIGDHCSGYAATAAGGGAKAAARVPAEECPAPLAPP